MLRTEHIELKLEVPGLQAPKHMNLKIGERSAMFANEFVVASQELGAIASATTSSMPAGKLADYLATKLASLLGS